jgi:hypothetical protein
MEAKMQVMEIDWNGKPEKVVIKRLSFGERMTVRKDSRTIKFAGGIQQTEVDEEKYVFLLLKFGVESAPFEVKNQQDLKLIDGVLIQDIADELEEFNKTSKDKKKESETRSSSAAQ